MNKSLEALEKISWRYVNEPTFQEWCNTIKQDLERLEVLEKLVTDDCIAGNQIGLDIVNSLITKNKQLEKENQELKYEYKLVREKKEKCIDYLCDRNQKLVKAIEIIKNKIGVELIENLNIQYEPLSHIKWSLKSNIWVTNLTQQEYELLKEILGD